MNSYHMYNYIVYLLGAKGGMGIQARPEPSVIYSPPGKISQKKLENPACFWNNVGENTSSLFQDKGAFE